MGEDGQPPLSKSLDRAVGRSAFGGEAELYDHARSGYAPALFEHLARRAVPAPRILEIGAGTGLATQGLLHCRPSRLTLIEPDDRLCRFLGDKFGPSGAEVVCGTFPEASVEGPFDLIACAAAFHWMEPGAALQQIKSLLAPGGIWAMWWNAYFGHGDGEFSARVSELLTAHEIALPPSYTGGQHYAFDADHHRAVLDRAGFGEIEHVVLHKTETLGIAEVQALFRTFSFISTLSDLRKARFLDSLAELVEAGFASYAPVTVTTALYSARHALR